MKKRLIILFLICLNISFSQNYFNNTYVQPNSNLTSDLSVSESEHYVLGQNVSMSHRIIKCYKLSNVGDTLWVKNYSDGGKVFYAQRILDVGTGLYVFGSYCDSNNTSNYNFFLIKFTYSFEFEWFKNYGDAYYESGNEIIRTEDNGFLLAGSSSPLDSAFENFYVVKTDSLGNEEWAKRFEYEWYSRISDVVQLNDGTFLASGTAYLPPTPDYWGNYDFMLIKFDPFGNEIWRKNIGTEDDDQQILHINLLNDNTLLLTGSSQIPNGVNYRAYLAKADLNGVIIWEKIYQNFGTLFVTARPVINIDQSFVLPIRATNDESKTFSMLLKYDLYGHLLWERNYLSTFSNNTNFFSEITAIKKTSDNGYIFCGSALDSLDIQRAWVVKTDCFGCDSTLCYYPDSICDVYDCSLYPINSDFTASSYLVDYNLNDSVQFVNLSANTTNRVWDFGDDSIAYTDSAVSHLYSATGTYEVQLIVYHGACSDTLIQTVVVSDNVGLSEMQLNALISVYPNPSNGSFSIENKTGKELKIEISDALGKTIDFTTVGINTTSNLVNVNTQKNGSGIYFLTLSDGEFIFRQKIVLE